MKAKVYRINSQEPIEARLKRRVIGQDHVIDKIMPYLKMFEAGLNPEGKPAGNFLLLGPTGVGKTHLVESLAMELHGDRKKMLKVDAAEIVHEGDASKLVGSPPGYIGHKETKPIISPETLNGVRSDNSKLALILIDEAEKGNPSLHRMLLSMFDRASLTLGDNRQVNLEDTMIFLTSNLGSREIAEKMEGGMGFVKSSRRDVGVAELEATTRRAVGRFFTPEFLNRLDEIITYRSLTKDDFYKILDGQFLELQTFYTRRIKGIVPLLRVTGEAKETIIANVLHYKNGGRELKRMMQRMVAQPIAEKILEMKQAGTEGLYNVHIDSQGDKEISISFAKARIRKKAA